MFLMGDLNPSKPWILYLQTRHHPTHLWRLLQKLNYIIYSRWWAHIRCSIHVNVIPAPGYSPWKWWVPILSLDGNRWHIKKAKRSPECRWPLLNSGTSPLALKAFLFCATPEFLHVWVLPFHIRTLTTKYPVPSISHRASAHCRALSVLNKDQEKQAGSALKPRFPNSWLMAVSSNTTCFPKTPENLSPSGGMTSRVRQSGETLGGHNSFLAPWQEINTSLQAKPSRAHVTRPQITFYLEVTPLEPWHIKSTWWRASHYTVPLWLALSPVAQPQSQSCGCPAGFPLPIEETHPLQGSGLSGSPAKWLTITEVRQSGQGLAWGQFPSTSVVPCIQLCSWEGFQEAQAPILEAIQTKEQNNGPQRCPCPNPQSPPPCYFPGQNRLCRCH